MSRRSVPCSVELDFEERSPLLLETYVRETIGVEFAYKPNFGYYRTDTGVRCCSHIGTDYAYLCTRSQGHVGPHSADDTTVPPWWE